MKRTSIRACMVVAFCLVFSSVRPLQTEAAITNSGEPTLLLNDQRPILVHGVCRTTNGHTLDGVCFGTIPPPIDRCAGEYVPSQCPVGAPVRKRLVLAGCFPPVSLEVDASRPCTFRLNNAGGAPI
jgi:hypothetical protein